MDPAVAYVRDLLRGLDAPWFLCGGWAADAWLGRPTREHLDVDIAVFRERGITVPLTEAVGRCPWGVPAFAPEIVLFYKAGGNLTDHGPVRARDQADFDALLPVLDAPRRAWLYGSLAPAWPGHPWLAALSP